ncbi:hypothetical protein [Nonomuraea diastatica]|uniref:Novel STAND NTPase 1 domain-containing protein n=1 Tax=Nonomuraea diastatica TaxID=1848329 RepID=A0A4R4VTZ0_9ACTN|nr:hypothetical protein [Nonomuraea diastatica]TDD08771.1 hypothetical protein E1294_47310 [Nonomuraea diastatica]
MASWPGWWSASRGPAPYRGLSAYEPEDARWFFGREHAVGVLVARLAGRPDERGPLTVVAPVSPS